MLSYTGAAAAVISAAHMHLYCFVQAPVAAAVHLNTTAAADQLHTWCDLVLHCCACTPTLVAVLVVPVAYSSAVTSAAAFVTSAVAGSLQLTQLVTALLQCLQQQWL
jgi:hypothetical protein